MNGNVKTYLALAIVLLWAHTLFTAHTLVSQDDALAMLPSSEAMRHIRDALRNRTMLSPSSFLLRGAPVSERRLGLALGADDGFERAHLAVLAAHAHPAHTMAAASSIGSGSNSSSSGGNTPRSGSSNISRLNSEPSPDDDESYHIVFSTGCSEFQDWQSVGVYSSAGSVGQRGIVTRIASGCTPPQEHALRQATSRLPPRCRIHFAPNTQVRDSGGNVYKYANKPLGMMHWLTYADPPVPWTATVALIDPDMFFLRPLWHDSFDAPAKYLVSGAAKRTPVPPRVMKGTMVAQQYGIGGAPWATRKPTDAKQPGWGLPEFFASVGRPRSPALDPDLTEASAGTWFSIGAPYIAVASDWLPLATNWTNLMPMAVARNFGNLAEMYAMVLAAADLGLRPSRVDHLMVSNVDARGEGWPWVDALPMDQGCNPAIFNEARQPLPVFLHYCQRYEIESLKAAALSSSGPAGADWMFSKYQVPDAILACPAGSQGAADSGAGAQPAGKRHPKKFKMRLTAEGLLPEPPATVVASNLKELRNVFSHCTATRATNRAALDYRRWFCSAG